MIKKVAVLFLLLVLCLNCFATTTNSIETFALSFNENTNQLNVSLLCKAQTIGVLTLSNGASRTIICPTLNLGSSWYLGDQASIDSVSGTLVIQSPCDVCSKTAQVVVQESVNQSWLDGIIAGMLSPTVLFLIFISFMAVLLGWVVNKVGNH